MTPIICAKTLPPKKRSPSSPTTRHAHSNIHSTSISMPSAISWNAASQNSSSSVASLPASKKPPKITKPSSLSLLSSYGCDKCPHRLEQDLKRPHNRRRASSFYPPRFDRLLGYSSRQSRQAFLRVLVRVHHQPDTPS